MHFLIQEQKEIIWGKKKNRKILDDSSILYVYCYGVVIVIKIK